MKNNDNIEISALRVFAAVSEATSLTQAAERLGITQSAVSQTIKQLERQTQAQLVLTRSRPIKLTPSGLILKGYADSLLQDTKRMLIDVRNASFGGTLPLNIGMIDSFCDVAGLQFMQKMRPLTSKVALRTGLVSPLTQALLNRDLDVLITSDPVDNHPELQRLPLLRDPIVMIVPNEYPTDSQTTPTQLAQALPFIHYNRQSRLGSLTELIARRLNITLESSYELDSTQTLLKFVQSGQGWAFTSALCLVSYPKLCQNMQVLPLTKGANARYLSLLCRNNELGNWAQTMADICRSIYDEDIVLAMNAIATWLGNQAYSICEAPTI
jgi:DNA-binding transcriptional LysR family regulator